MEIEIVLLSDWKEHVKGTVLSMGKDMAEKLIDLSIAKNHDQEEDEKQKNSAKKALKDKEEMAKSISEMVKEAITSAAKSAKGIFVGEDRELNDKTGGFKRLSNFLDDIWRAGKSGEAASERLTKWTQMSRKAPTSPMTEGTPSQGGYLVPEEFSDRWAQPALENAIVSPRAADIPMATNTIKMPALVDSDHSSNYFGMTFSRPAENAQKSQTRPKISQIQLDLHELVALIPVSNQLLEDSPISVEGILNSVVPMGLAFQMDADFLSGNGVAKPMGAFNAGNPSLVTVAKEAGQGADTIVAENTLKMLAQTKIINLQSTAWVANLDCLPLLATMSLAVGTGGIPVYLPANGAAGSPHPTLWGIPILYSEKMETVGDKGDIGLADFSQYLIGSKGGIKTAQSVHLWFDYNAVAFRYEVRYDGKSSWKTSQTPYKGAKPLSPFVVLAARA